MKIVAMIERSAGNEVAGETWTETAIFSSEEMVSNVIAWAAGRKNMSTDDKRINITLSVPCKGT